MLALVNSASSVDVRVCSFAACVYRWLWLITPIRDNITFTATDIHSTINTHNTELELVNIHITNTNHITIANIYIPPRDNISTHYKTVDKDIQHITNIPDSVLTGDVNAHSIP